MKGVECSVPKADILVVDDEPEICKFLEHCLAKALPSCRIRKAFNGLEAVSLYDYIKPRVVIMDFYMPIMNGVDAFYMIQNNCISGGMERPCVIFHTPFALPARLMELMEKEERYCLMPKPVDVKELIAEVSVRLVA